MQVVWWLTPCAENKNLMPKILILGYGNPDREDDGVAWHVLQKLAHYFNRPITTMDSLEFDHQSGHVSSPASRRLPASPDLAFALQLAPEMAEVLAQYQQVCFIDAHTGAFPEEIRLARLEPGYQSSPFTHHLTAESCLSLAQTLYGHAPDGVLISIRGYSFGYGVELSEPTALLVEPAVERIVNWVVQCREKVKV
ncbi:MAG: hydrogenase maturation protease [Anaerolineae bacterium]